jgi:hypothetical protein
MLHAPPAHAATITYDAALFGFKEVPPAPSPASGTATLTLDDVANTLAVNESFVFLNGPATAAHIHCCEGRGISEPVVVPFPGIPGGDQWRVHTQIQLAGRDHLYVHVLDDDEWRYGERRQGVDDLEVERRPHDVKIHTSTFPDGEIRGQVAPVPEQPATLTLLGIGLGLLAVARSRARASNNGRTTTASCEL